MSYSSCLAKRTDELVLDASVFINLSASGYVAAILEALPSRVLMVDIAAAEVRQDQRQGRSDSDALRTVVESKLVDVVTLGADGLVVYERLVLALDDGEASTIAAAVEHGTIAVLDDRRARRRCREAFPSVVQASTLDLFSHPTVALALGKRGLAEAVHNALAHARMAVREEQRDWVVELVGAERAKGYASMGRLRSRPDG